MQLGRLDALVLSLCNHCQRITELSMPIMSISEAGLEAISRHMKRLRRLKLLSCHTGPPYYSNAVMRSLLERLPCLQLLHCDLRNYDLAVLVGINRYVRLTLP